MGLIKIFWAAAKGVAVAGLAATLYTESAASDFDLKRKGGEALTEGEVELIHSVFGDQIETQGMRKHFGDYFERTVKPNGDVIVRGGGTVEGGSRHHMNFWGSVFSSDDYSREDAELKSLFMHEATHIWQHQSRYIFWNQIFNGCKIYDYELNSSSDFDDFCVEQQASIVGDYVGLILYPDNGLPGIYTEQDRLLARVVEAEFPQAKITREKLERQFKSSIETVPYFDVFTPA